MTFITGLRQKKLDEEIDHLLYFLKRILMLLWNPQKVILVMLQKASAQNIPILVLNYHQNLNLKNNGGNDF
jgi:hypothetical protein